MYVVMNKNVQIGNDFFVRNSR